MARGPKKEYSQALVVRCGGCHDAHATSSMTRKNGGWICDGCVKTEFKSIWSTPL